MENQQPVIITPTNVEEVIAKAGTPGGLSLEDFMNLDDAAVDLMWDALMGEC